MTLFIIDAGQQNRVLKPDLTMGTWPDFFTAIDASAVLSVCEITSPGNATTDHGPKTQLYATAGIPWYLLAEPDLKNYQTVTLRLLRLEGAHYVERAGAKHGETLTSDVPFPLSISTEALLRR